MTKKTKKTTKKKAAANPRPLGPDINPVVTELFNDWYSKVASKKVDKIEKKWLKENEPNNPDEDGGGDFWCVNEMMFNGDAHELTAENAEQVFIWGYYNEPWSMSQSDSLYCELDEVIEMAYKAGKKSRKS